MDRRTWLIFLLSTLFIDFNLNFCVARVALELENIKPPENEISEFLYEKPLTLEEMESDDFLMKYETLRKNIIYSEKKRLTGGNITLNGREMQVHQLLRRHKLIELTKGLKNPLLNTAGMHYFNAKPLILKSEVYKILQKMPKGALLHVHNTASVSSEWFIKKLTYRDGMMKCNTKDGNIALTFRKNPTLHKCAGPYEILKNARSKQRCVKSYDKALENKINLHTTVPEIHYNTIDKVWTSFENMFNVLGDVLRYRPAFEEFHNRMLEELLEDEIYYAEVRMSFKELYDDNNKTISKIDAVKLLINLSENFKKSHTDFLGIKIIYPSYRNLTYEQTLENFKTFKELHQMFPDFIIGFDLVGQEDRSNTLHRFIKILKDAPPTAKYFFHAGETNWYGVNTDLNLLDAILLNATRLGHGFALSKHPDLLDSIKTKKIAIEVSPISNQVLNLVRDLRNHPATVYLSRNVPIVITNDDPGFWDAKGLTFDYYFTIMSLSPAYAGLHTLKQLVFDSITYSAMNEKEKIYANDVLNRKWNEFIDTILNESQ